MSVHYLWQSVYKGEAGRKNKYRSCLIKSPQTKYFASTLSYSKLQQNKILLLKFPNLWEIIDVFKDNFD